MMGKPVHRGIGKLMAPVFCWASLGGSLGGCGMERLSGTSVGTGNPQVVTLSFYAGAVAARVSGQVTLYAADHNPLVETRPLAAFAVEDRDSLELLQESLLTALGLSPPGPDSAYRVNVLLRTVDGRGAWYPQVALGMREGRLQALGGPRIELPVVPLVCHQGTLQLVDALKERRYLTLFGSPFFAKVSAGGFALDSLPRGRYEALLVRFLEDGPIEEDGRPSPVHFLDDSLDTELVHRLTPAPHPFDSVPLPLSGPREEP